MKLTGGAQARLAALTPPGHEARIDLTITDEWPMAQAFVIIRRSLPAKHDPPGGAARQRAKN
jgi:holo-[acyl-carrier protein] synthase